jgi:lipopolysaccharide export LptBFGC system permease protein LptF
MCNSFLQRKRTFISKVKVNDCKYDDILKLFHDPKKYLLMDTWLDEDSIRQDSNESNTFYLTEKLNSPFIKSTRLRVQYTPLPTGNHWIAFAALGVRVESTLTIEQGEEDQSASTINEQSTLTTNLFLYPFTNKQFIKKRTESASTLPDRIRANICN